MKDIKNVSFSELLLIPTKDRFESSDYPLSHYKGYLCGSNGEDSTTVHILLFNCSKKEEISSLVGLEIETLEKYISENPNVEEVKTQLRFFSKLKEDLNTSALHHTPTDDLIQFVSQSCIPEVKKENILFLSGVSYLVEE